MRAIRQRIGIITSSTQRSCLLRTAQELSAVPHNVADERGSAVALDEKGIPLPPRMPEEYECCGNGCAECVWTIYFDRYAAYERRLSEYKAKKKGDYSANDK